MIDLKEVERAWAMNSPSASELSPSEYENYLTVLKFCNEQGFRAVFDQGLDDRYRVIIGKGAQYLCTIYLDRVEVEHELVQLALTSLWSL